MNIVTKALTFKGGVHPPHRKEATAHKPIEECSVPDQVVIPLQQHTGAPCQPLVAKGDRVVAGQKIGDSEAFVSAPVHASVTGEVAAVEPRLHPTGMPMLSVVIKVDHESDEYVSLPPLENPEPDEIRQRARDAGLVGLGGAAFPTHVKLAPPKEKPVDAVIVNGCECEPYLTCDHRQMLEDDERLVDGLRLLMKTVGAKKGYIAIETNKRDAIENVLHRVNGENGVQVVPVIAKYPQGAEKQLIKAILNRTIPSGGLPMDVGALVQNAGTTIALSRAVREGRPLIDRVITVTGPGISNPKNLRVRIGTPMKHVVEETGGLNGDGGKLVMGGPMTGMPLFDLDVPVVKGTSGLVVLPIPKDGRMAGPCVRCGRCVEICPMKLMPNFIGTYAEVEMWDKTEDFRVMDCIECGSCAFVCPSRRPLIHLIKLAKYKIRAKKAG